VKIKEVEAFNLFYPFSERIIPPASLPTGEGLREVAYAGYRTVITKITCEDGTVGFGESMVRLAPEAVVSIIHSLKPILAGRDIFDVGVIWEQMFATMANRGHYQGYLIEAMSGIDIALWDLIGRTLKKPVFALLGGAFNKRLPCYASSIRISDREEAVPLALQWVKQGFKVIKVKIGANPSDPTEDLELVGDLRAAVGPSIKIMVDANCGFDTYAALQVAQELEKYNIYWFEEPLAPDDLDGYLILSSKSKIPIAAGESVFTRYGFRDLISKKAVSIIQPEICKAGGFTECLKIAAMSSAFHIPYSPHAGSILSAIGAAASIHLSAALPNFLIHEYQCSYWEKDKDKINPFRLLAGGPVERVDQGYMEILQGPGLGIEIDEAKLLKYRI